MFDGRFRAPIERAVKPVGDTLRRTRLTPDQLTMAGLVLAVAAAITIGAGYLLAGFILVVLAALPDMLDGALAKAAGASSQRGAYFDSVADRVTDMLLFGGVAWYFAADDRGVLTMLPVAVIGLSTLISYQRAKAESLGLEAKGGLMERAERIILLCLGLLVPVLLVPILWVMLALTAFTAVQRFVRVWNQANAATVVLERQAARRQRRIARRSARSRRWSELRRNRGV
jgi:CDP-diacylglycerol--glycerol-3-phosphate 3-phosphatidyltransferase